MTARAIAISAAILALAGCTTMPGGDDGQFAACPAYKPAYEVTDAFMRTFNSRDAEAWGATFHFPSVRIASGNVRIINGPADLENAFTRLEEQGWHHSAWAARKIVQCGPTKAHMLTTFVRYRADNTVLSQFDSLYIVEFKNNRWALTARSSFAP
ncbi:MAG TPA: hypothetical protein VFV70_15385 [Hyphomonadaceae bacterium]|nr:hypothetical protein [Hyphomonadaceae bacterium]